MSEEGIAAGAPAPAVRVDPITGLVDAPPRKLDEPSPRPWRLEGKCIYTAHGDFIGEMEHSDDARFVVDAVNQHKHHGKAINELLAEYDRIEAERDRLNEDIESWRSGYIKARTERNAYLLERDRLRDIVRKALPFIEGAIDGVSTILGDAEMSKAAGECGAPPKDVQEAFVADGRRVLREARAAIGEGGRLSTEPFGRPANPGKRPFARVCDLPAGEIFAALKQRKNIDATFTTRLIVDCLLSPATDDPGDVAQRNVDDVKFFIRSAVSLIRAHYDRHERSFHEVADRIAKRLDEIGMGDLASFVRAQTGDEPSWVPMDAAPTNSAPTPAPPTLGSLLAEARRLLERAQNTTRDTGVIADISESLECLSGAEDYAKATEGHPASESTASPAPSGEDSEKPAPDRTPPWPRCEREADEVEKRAGFARFCSTCGTACRYAGEEHLVICKHHQFAIK